MIYYVCVRVSLTTGNFSCGSITHVISRTRDWVLNTWQNVFAFMHCSMDILKVQSGVAKNVPV